MAFSAKEALSYEDENLLGLVDRLKKKSPNMASKSDSEVVDSIFSMVKESVGDFGVDAIKGKINEPIDIYGSIGLIDHIPEGFPEKPSRIVPTEYLINFFIRSSR